MIPSWKSQFEKAANADLLKKIPKLTQRQDSTMEQLRDLVSVAEKLGMYDAADVIKSRLLKRE